MNILFVANRFPYPPFRGDKLKIYNLAKHLSKRHELYLITFIQDKNDYMYINELKEFFKEIEIVYLPKLRSMLNCALNMFSSDPLQIHYFRSEVFGNLLKKFISEHEIDVVHTQHLRMSQYTYNISGIPTVLDLPDAYSLYWERRSLMEDNYFRHKFGSMEHKKVLEYESIIKNFDMTLVCSQEDKSQLEYDHQYRKINILPNGVDTSTFYSEYHDYNINNRLIFTGNMAYYPNTDAAVYFVKEIFPGILKKNPEIKFYIVGQNPPQKIKELQSRNVIVTGFVDSIAEEYKKSAIAVSPVRVGAGTLNKVLEPMAMGIPVVSSQIGFEGIGAASGEEILLASDTDSFIESVNSLLSDRDYRQKIGEGGRNLVLRNYGWDKVSGLLENYFYQVCGEGKRVKTEDLQTAV